MHGANSTAFGDLEDEDGDTLQDDPSGNLHPREGSIQELIDKYQGSVKNQFDASKNKGSDQNAEDECDAEPN